MARLYVVATPIGNLGDITIRAIEILKTVALVACEDTRHSRPLLTHLGISVPTASCREQKADSACFRRVLAELESGHDVALITDAGTPGVSDPGSSLVRAVRAEGFEVSPIPGASAVTALFSVSGWPGRGWVFEGFLPPKGAKRTRRLTELLARGEAFLLFEGPHRIKRLVEEILAVSADVDLVVGRELTKLHEQIVADTALHIAEFLESGRIPARGEFVLLVRDGKNR